MSRELEQRIEALAEEEGASLASTVIRLLMRATGMRRPDEAGARGQRHHDLDELAGTWSADEAADFDRGLQEQRRVDSDLWS